MTRSSTETPSPPLQASDPFSTTSHPTRNRAHDPFEYTSLTVIPWRDIWGSVELARERGHAPMITAFYEMLLREGLFDDRGAWSLKIPQPK